MKYLSMKKSILSANENDLSKRAKLKQNCIHITRSLFKCSSSHQINDYEYISYGSSSDHQQLDLINHQPLSSTIHPLSTHVNHAFEQSELSIITDADSVDGDSDSLGYCSSSCSTQIEKTRRQATVLHNKQININDDTTILRTNNSPSSKLFLFNTSVESIDKHCMQSTKLSNDSEYHSMQLLPSSLDSSIVLSTPSSPLLSSTLNEFSSKSRESLLMRLKQSNKANYVCTKDYKATFVEDLDISRGDCVSIIKDDNQEWLYVQLIHNGLHGYVPRENISDIQSYIKHLELQQKRFIPTEPVLFGSSIQI